MLTRFLLFVACGFFIGGSTSNCLAQAEALSAQPESREIALPVEIIQTKKDPERVTGLSGRQHDVYIVHSQEINGLSAKSIHIFQDGAEQPIQHFEAEEYHSWMVRDNKAQHVEYSCTPNGMWGGPDQQKVAFGGSRFHTYLLTYNPPPSPEASCHRIAVKVDHGHSKVFAPHQYCNTKDPLFDPLNGTRTGAKILRVVNSRKAGALRLTVQVVPFLTASGAYRVHISAKIPANRLRRAWDGLKLYTSIALLGLVYDRNDVLASRFSDTACLPSENFEYTGLEPSINVGNPSDSAGTEAF